MNDWAMRLRAALFDAVSEQDVIDIGKNLVDRAKKGDLGAAKLILGMVAGSQPGPAKPKRTVDVDGDEGGEHIRDRSAKLAVIDHEEVPRSDAYRKTFEERGKLLQE